MDSCPGVPRRRRRVARRQVDAGDAGGRTARRRRCPAAGRSGTRGGRRRRGRRTRRGAATTWSEGCGSSSSTSRARSNGNDGPARTAAGAGTGRRSTGCRYGPPPRRRWCPAGGRRPPPARRPRSSSRRKSGFPAERSTMVSSCRGDRRRVLRRSADQLQSRRHGPGARAPPATVPSGATNPVLDVAAGDADQPGGETDRLGQVAEQVGRRLVHVLRVVDDQQARGGQQVGQQVQDGRGPVGAGRTPRRDHGSRRCRARSHRSSGR